MGHKEKLKGGDEYDFLTRARRYYHHKAGQIRKIKRKFWKRQRAEVRDQMKGDNNAED